VTFHRFSLLLHGFIDNLEGFVNDSKAFFDFLLVDDKWRITKYVAPSHQGIQSVVLQVVLEFSNGWVSWTVVRDDWVSILIFLEI
jgi:hypothetical protein